MNDNNNQAEFFEDHRSCTIDYHDYDESEGQNLRKVKGNAPLTDYGNKSTQKKSTTITETKKNEEDIKDIKEATKTEVRQEPKKKLFEANEEQKDYKTESNKEIGQNFVKNIYSSECSSIKIVNDINLIPQNSSNPINYIDLRDTQDKNDVKKNIIALLEKVSLDTTNENKIENEIPEGNKNEINHPAPREIEKEKTLEKQNQNQNDNINNNESPMSMSDERSEGEGKDMSISEGSENVHIIDNNQNTELNNNNTIINNDDSTANITHNYNYNYNNDGNENNLQENYDIEFLKNESSNEDNDERLKEDFEPPNTNHDNNNQ